MRYQILDQGMKLTLDAPQFPHAAVYALLGREIEVAAWDWVEALAEAAAR